MTSGVPGPWSLGVSQRPSGPPRKDNAAGTASRLGPLWTRGFMTFFSYCCCFAKPQPLGHGRFILSGQLVGEGPLGQNREGLHQPCGGGCKHLPLSARLRLTTEMRRLPSSAGVFASPPPRSQEGGFSAPACTAGQTGSSPAWVCWTLSLSATHRHPESEATTYWALAT